jgi:hypothetical protein
MKAEARKILTFTKIVKWVVIVLEMNLLAAGCLTIPVCIWEKGSVVYVLN